MKAEYLTPRMIEDSNRIIGQVAQAHGLPLADLVNCGRRTQAVLAARAEAICLLRDLTPIWGFPSIGRVLGIDHAAALRTYRRCCDTLRSPVHAEGGSPCTS